MFELPDCPFYFTEDTKYALTFRIQCGMADKVERFENLDDYFTTNKSDS